VEQRQGGFIWGALNSIDQTKNTTKNQKFIKRVYSEARRSIRQKYDRGSFTDAPTP
jgi:hypothetical protein